MADAAFRKECQATALEQRESEETARRAATEAQRKAAAAAAGSVRGGGGATWSAVVSDFEETMLRQTVAGRERARLLSREAAERFEPHESVFLQRRLPPSLHIARSPPQPAPRANAARDASVDDESLEARLLKKLSGLVTSHSEPNVLSGHRSRASPPLAPLPRLVQERPSPLSPPRPPAMSPSRVSPTHSSSLPPAEPPQPPQPPSAQPPPRPPPPPPQQQQQPLLPPPPLLGRALSPTPDDLEAPPRFHKSPSCRKVQQLSHTFLLLDDDSHDDDEHDDDEARDDHQHQQQQQQQQQQQSPVSAASPASPTSRASPVVSVFSPSLGDGVAALEGDGFDPPSPEAVFSLLRALPCLRGCSGAAVRLLAKLAQFEVVEKFYGLYLEGMPADRMYVLVRGQIRLSNRRGEAHEVTEGGSFGEAALVDELPRRENAVATTQASLLAIAHLDLVGAARAGAVAGGGAAIAACGGSRSERGAARCSLHHRLSATAMRLGIGLSGTQQRGLEESLLLCLLTGVHGLFRGMAEAELRQVAQLVSFVQLPEGAVIYKAGDAASAFYIVVRGTVRLLASSGGSSGGSGGGGGKKEGDEEEEEVLTEARAETATGQCFGSVGLLDHAPRLATAKCACACSLVCVAARHFAALLRLVPYLEVAVEEERHATLTSRFTMHVDLPAFAERLRGEEEAEAEAEAVDERRETGLELMRLERFAGALPIVQVAGMTPEQLAAEKRRLSWQRALRGVTKDGRGRRRAHGAAHEGRRGSEEAAEDELEHHSPEDDAVDDAPLSVDSFVRAAHLHEDEEEWERRRQELEAQGASSAELHAFELEKQAVRKMLEVSDGGVDPWHRRVRYADQQDQPEKYVLG